MSVVKATKPLRRRALERQGMTEEVELELLIQEQQVDDTDFVRPQEGLRVVSFDSPAPLIGMHTSHAEDAVANFVSVNEDGEIVSFLPRSAESVFLVSFKHSTFDAYNNHGCRCRQCKFFMAEYRRQKRAA
jgi:hypothetical protein